jgi:hypothetical protein
MKTKNPEKPQCLLFPCLIILLTLFLCYAPTKVYGLSGNLDLFFDSNTSDLSKNSIEQLKSFAEWMKAHPTITVVIEGYSDENESFECNLALAERRAKSTIDYLITLGIAPARLKTFSDGEVKQHANSQKASPLAQNKGARLVAESREKSISPKRVFSWQYLYLLNEEKYGYATYSYVLTGRSAITQDENMRYLKLIDAVKGQSTPDKLIKSSSRGFYNLFLIPSAKKTTAANAEPNYGLSKQLLDNISIKLPKAVFNQGGPYIITLYKPVGEGDPNTIADILYADLTKVHPAAFPEVVRAYKSHISSEQIQGIERLKSFRADLLNLMLITEECTGFAKVAYAELQSSFSQAGQGKSGMQQSHEAP